MTDPAKRTSIITIDGPAAAGKSTAARLLAQRLGFVLLDSGALYRCVALHLLRRKIPPNAVRIPEEAISALEIAVEPAAVTMKVLLNGEDVTALLRHESISEAASRFSALPEVRQALLDLQRSTGEQWNLVAEGRDMGTVVFPHARFKFFLIADLDERARRRYLELIERGERADFDQVRSQMIERDQRDATRKASPLVMASDALAIDAGALSPDEVVDRIMCAIEGEASSLNAAR
ncbi:MAG: (d)CMP kinase [Desulfomonile tiedjei]|nr:(d)CMP kinase [Desulfomonile tiedjei]